MPWSSTSEGKIEEKIRKIEYFKWGFISSKFSRANLTWVNFRVDEMENRYRQAKNTWSVVNFHNHLSFFRRI
jgi:hypothetical protein